MSPEAFSTAVARLERRERFEGERDADLVRLYTLYVKELDRLGRARVMAGGETIPVALRAIIMAAWTRFAWPPP